MGECNLKGSCILKKGLLGKLQKEGNVWFGEDVILQFVLQ